MTFMAEMHPETGLIDAARVRDRGRELSGAYAAAAPFPHVVIDDFLPTPIVDMCLAEFERGRNDRQVLYDRAQERLKREFRPDEMARGPRNLFYTFNSRPFIAMVENVTGIKGLVPDPHFLGAGFHEIHTGGHLSVHADFNRHRLLNLERRVNLLVYLNRDWTDEHGGQLELWDADMRRCVRSIVPEINRCVIFNTTSTSHHGNPQPVNHPDGRSRKSIALYYYTATWSKDKRAHTTRFRVRPGSSDRPDYKIKALELARDLAPPLLWRSAAAMLGRKVA